jgi:hypothetical protein
VIDNDLDQASSEVAALFQWRRVDSEFSFFRVPEHVRDLRLDSVGRSTAQRAGQRLIRRVGHVFARQGAEPSAEWVPLAKENVYAGIELLEGRPQPLQLRRFVNRSRWRSVRLCFVHVTGQAFDETVMAERVGQRAEPREKFGFAKPGAERQPGRPAEIDADAPKLGEDFASLVVGHCGGGA